MPAVMKKKVKSEDTIREFGSKPEVKYQKEVSISVIEYIKTLLLTYHFITIYLKIEKELSMEESLSLSYPDSEMVDDSNNNIKKKESPIKRPFRSTRGVVYIKHLPHGFFEHQLKEYFGQFGKVTRARLCRSQRTLNSKGYGFIEFQIPEVAQIAAETMDNYMMFNRTIKTSYIPPEAQQHDFFRTRLSSIKRAKNTSLFRINRNRANNMYNRPKKTPEIEKKIHTLHKKLEKLGNKYKELGIDFDVNAVFPKIKISLDETYQPNDTLSADDSEPDEGKILNESDVNSSSETNSIKRRAPKNKVATVPIKILKTEKKEQTKENLSKVKKNTKSENLVLAPVTAKVDKKKPVAKTEEKTNSKVIKNKKNANLLVIDNEDDEQSSEDEQPPQRITKSQSKEKSSKIKKVAVGGIHKKTDAKIKKNQNVQKMKFALDHMDKENVKSIKDTKNLKKQKQKK